MKGFCISCLPRYIVETREETACWTGPELTTRNSHHTAPKLHTRQAESCRSKEKKVGANKQKQTLHLPLLGEANGKANLAGLQAIRCLLHPRVLSVKFAGVYFPLLSHPLDKFMKGYFLVTSNQKEANSVTVTGWHAKHQLQIGQASIAGFFDIF